MVFIIVVLFLAALIFILIFAGKTAGPEFQKGQSYTSIKGKLVEVSSIHEAWCEGDLDTMAKLMEEPCPHVDRHFLLQSIIEGAYRKRDEPAYKKLLMEAGGRHLSQFQELKPHIEAEFDGRLPNIPAFKYFAMFLVHEGLFKEAIAVCEEAIGYDLHDGTQSGYEGRIKRIKKKMAIADRKKEATPCPPPSPTSPGTGFDKVYPEWGFCV